MKRRRPSVLSERSPHQRHKSAKSTNEDHSSSVSERPSPFEYKALKDDEIRLLEILPGSDLERVSCRLHYASLNNLPDDYAALSYTWGDEAMDGKIMVNDQLLLVKPSLEVALREFRRKPVWYIPKNELHRFISVRRSLRRLSRGLSESQWLCKDLEEIGSLIEGGVLQVDTFIQVSKRNMTDSSHQKGADSDNLFYDETVAKIATISKSVEDRWNAYASKEGLALLHHDSQLIWIDAVCINQSDLKERSEQVKTMQKIYKGAFSLVVWLGAEENGSSKAFALLSAISEVLEHWPIGDFKPDKELGKHLADTMSPAELEESWSSLAALFARPWFTRAWVCQEFALGGQHIAEEDAITFCCGQARMSRLVETGWRMFAVESVRSLTFSLPKMRLTDDVIEPRTLSKRHIQKLAMCRVKYRIFPGNPQFLNLYCLLPLVIDLRDKIATDPRDKIYSIIGLAKELYGNQLRDLDSSVLLVDYTATVENVYSSFVQAVVRATKRLDILGLCYLGQGHYVQRTWTPDWTGHINESILMCDIAGSVIWESEDWTFNVSPGFECAASFATDLSSLTVSGLLWDEVRYVSSNELHEPWDRNTFRQHCNSILNLSEEIRKRTKIYASYLDLDALLLEILMLDRDAVREKRMETQIWIERFRDWMKGNEKCLLTELETEIPAILKDGVLNLDTLKDAARGLDMLKDMIYNQSNDGPDTAPDSTFSDFLRRSNLDSDRVILTRDGYIGRCRNTVDTGDLVCVLLGCAMPMVLRPTGGPYNVVGEAYLAGIMHGEAMTAFQEGKKTLREFELR